MADHARRVLRDNAYVLEMDDGETWTIPGTNSTIRFVTDERSAPFALVHSRGMPGEAVLPHFHVHAMDTWLVLQGKLHIWAGDEGRSLTAGDFAYVPPGVVHSFQVVEPHTEYLGLIHPAEWVNFFKALGERWEGPGPVPSKDLREFPKDKFIQAIKDGHDVVPQFGYKLGEVQHDWRDSEVPEESRAYFLKAHRGPRYALGGQTCAPVISTSCTGGKFAVNLLEALKSLEHPAKLIKLTFTKTCMVLFIQTGSFTLETDKGGNQTLKTGDTAYLPPGQAFKLTPESIFARAITFTDGPGHEVLFKAGGTSTKAVIGAEDSVLPSAAFESVKAAAVEHAVTLG